MVNVVSFWKRLSLILIYVFLATLAKQWRSKSQFLGPVSFPRLQITWTRVGRMLCTSLGRNTPTAKRQGEADKHSSKRKRVVLCRLLVWWGPLPAGAVGANSAALEEVKRHRFLLAPTHLLSDSGCRAGNGRIPNHTERKQERQEEGAFSRWQNVVAKWKHASIFHGRWAVTFLMSLT